jgi:hypothetical protein
MRLSKLFGNFVELLLRKILPEYFWYFEISLILHILRFCITSHESLRHAESPHFQPPFLRVWAARKYKHLLPITHN